MSVEPSKIAFGVGLDKFKLGMGVSEAISIISADHPRYADAVRMLHILFLIIYSRCFHRLKFEINFPRPEKVLNQEIMITLLDWGIRLRFQPVSQRLFLIDYYDITLRKFAIKGSTFGGDATQPVTFEMLHKSLGPTLPGQQVEDDHFLCNFGGASFLFSIPPEHLADVKSHLPISFGDGSSPILARIFLYPFELDISSPKSYPDVLPARVTVVLKPSVRQRSTIYIPSVSAKGTIVAVELGMCLQDILAILGDPAVAGMNPQTSSYRYEYPKLGMEFYFCESTHVLFQVVLRNNLAHCSDFGRFERCPFRIYYNISDDKIINSSETTPSGIIISSSAVTRSVPDATASEVPRSEPIEIDSITLKTKSKKKTSDKEAELKPEADHASASSSDFDVIYGPSNESSFIDPLTDDFKIRELMSDWFGGSAMTREASAQLPSPQGSPFADTLLYAYPEVIFI